LVEYVDLSSEKDIEEELLGDEERVNGPNHTSIEEREKFKKRIEKLMIIGVIIGSLVTYIILATTKCIICF
jgi:hypothetical protein